MLPGRTVRPELPARSPLDWITRRHGDPARFRGGLLLADGAGQPVTLWYYPRGSQIGETVEWLSGVAERLFADTTNNGMVAPEPVHGPSPRSTASPGRSAEALLLHVMAGDGWLSTSALCLRRRNLPLSVLMRSAILATRQPWSWRIRGAGDQIRGHGPG